MVDLRQRFMKRIGKFPALVRGEQLRARFIYFLINVIFCILSIGLGLLIISAIGFIIPSFRSVGFIVLIAFYISTTIWFVRRWGKILRQALGVRSRLLRRLDQRPIENAIGGDAKIGLHLRAFADEDTFVPVSREMVNRALGSIGTVFFISVSNPLQDHSAGASRIPILEVPSAAWTETVFELMQIAAVIVVDTNAGIFHWADDIHGSSLASVQAMAAEFGRRLGFVAELREIVANDFAYKTVAVVPPGWAEWKATGKIEEQIVVEEYAAKRAKELHPLLIDVDDKFPRTELKIMLLKLPLTVVTEDELRATVLQVVSEEPHSAGRGGPALSGI